MLPRTLAPGSSLGRYAITGILGRGGMGIVYAGTAPGGSRVAIKVLAEAIELDDDADRRFSREAAAAAKVHHPNVARLIEGGSEGGRRYLVFELVPGGSLRARLEREGPLPWAEVVRLGIGVGHGLRAIHEAGLVHRDLKPDNVLVGADGSPRIADFGLVRRAPGRSSLSQRGRLTQEGQFLGTPSYMPPEQVDRPDQVDGRADLYAFGATLFALLTGRPPFEGEGISLLNAVLNARAPRASSRAEVPPRLDALVAALLEKEADARPASASEVLAELEAIRDGAGGQGRGRGLGRAAAVAGLVLALGGGGAAVVLSRPRPAPAASPSLAAPSPAAPSPSSTTGVSTSALTPSPRAPATRVPPGYEHLAANEPARLARVLGSPRWRAAGPGGTGCFLPDGRVAMGTFDHVLRIVDPATGDERSFPVENNVVSLAALDSRRVLVGLWGGTIEVWDVVAGKRLRNLSALQGRCNVRRLSVAPAKRFCALADDGRLAYWNDPDKPRTWVISIETDEKVGPGEPLGGGVSPDGARFVSGGKDGVLRIFETATGKRLARWKAADTAIHSCFFTRDGSRIVLVCNDPSVRVVNPETGAVEKTIPLSLGEPCKTAFALALAPDGHTVAAGRDEAVLLLDLEAPGAPRVLARHRALVRELAFSPDGRTLLSVGHEGVARLTDVATGEDRRVGVSPVEGAVRALAVDARGSTALVAHGEARVRVLDVRSLEVRATYDEAAPLRALALSPSGAEALSHAEGGLVRAWETGTGATLWSTQVDAAAHGALAFADEARFLVPLSVDSIAVRRWKEWTEVWHSEAEDVRCASVTGDGTILTGAEVADTHNVKHRSAGTGLAVAEAFERKHVIQWISAARGGVLVAGVEGEGEEPGGEISLVPQGSRPGTAWQRKLAHGFVAAALSPEGLDLVVASGVEVLRLAPATGEVRARISLAPAGDRPRALAFVPGTQRLLVGTARGVILELELP